MYLGIPPEKTGLTNEDLEPASRGGTKLKGGFYYGMSRRGTVYVAPRPLLNHGVHRCASNPPPFHVKERD